MKKILLLLCTLCALVSVSSCVESADTTVDWGFAETPDGAPVNGMEQLIGNNVDILAAFDDVFYSSGEKLGLHRAVLRAQSGRNSAAKNASKLADSAHSRVADLNCVGDYYFVVRINYGSESTYSVVWNHDYRAK